MPPARVRIPSPEHFSQAPSQSRLSTDDRDNEMIPGTVHKSPGIGPTAEGNPGKPQIGDQRMKIVRPVIASNGSFISK